jgi:hypothetical protein
MREDGLEMDVGETPVAVFDSQEVQGYRVGGEERTIRLKDARGKRGRGEGREEW